MNNDRNTNCTDVAIKNDKKSIDKTIFQCHNNGTKAIAKKMKRQCDLL